MVSQGTPTAPFRGNDTLTQAGIIAAAIYLVGVPLGHTAALRAFSLSIALIAAAVLWWRQQQRDWPPMLPVFGIWLAVALLSLLSSVDRSASLQEIWREVLRAGFCFYGFHGLSRHTDSFRLWGIATAISALVLSALALASSISQGFWLPGYLPALGDFSTITLTLLPLLLVHALHGTKTLQLRALMLIAILTITTSAYFTHSRGFWLSLIGALIAATAASAWSGLKLQRKTVLTIALACTIALALAAKVAGDKNVLLSKFDDRAPIYSAVIEKLGNNPLTGTGYGHETDRNWYQSVPDLVPGVFHAHNIVLSYLDQMGPGGLLPLLLIFGMPLIAFLKILKRYPDNPLALAGIALLVAVFVKNSMDFFFCRSSLLLFFAHLGIYLGQLQRQQDQADGGKPSQPMAVSSSPMRCS